MWFKTNGIKYWSLSGHTILSTQLDFINKLPSHSFKAELRSCDDLDRHEQFDIIYSIEAFVHSLDERHILKTWANALADEGILVIINNFLTVSTDKECEDMQLHAKSWMSNVL